MKARRVKGLDAAGTLAVNAGRVVRVRAAELRDLSQPALGGDVDALHDMRIAAKRLRYVLEATAPAFGPFAAVAAKRARQLQEVLGEIHDADVMLPRVERLLESGDPAGQEGLQALRADLLARRAEHFGRAGELWAELDDQDFDGELERALAQPARP